MSKSATKSTSSHIFHILYYIICFVLLVSACGTLSHIKPVPVENNTIVEYRDTTIYKDSIIYTPIEVVKEIVPVLDTLRMETSLAEAEAYIDTTMNVLRGSIKNKKGITEKIKYKDRIVYRDSIVTKEVPVEVQVEKIVKTHFWYERILWVFAVFGLVILGLKIVKYIYGTKI